MPTLRKRKRSDKRTVWDIRYYADGKRQTFTIGETDTRTAQKIYHEFCARLAQGKLDGNIVIPRGKVARDERTLSGLAKHAASFAAVNKKPATAEREQNVFDRLLALMGDIPVSALTHQRVEEYKAIRLQEVSPATLNIEIRILNTAINQAIETEWIETDFRKKAFRQIRIPESDSKTSLSGAQITRLLSTKDMEFRRYLIFLLCTGCRRSEALEITWNDIDLDDGVVFVRGSVGKMGKRRQIPINDQLLEILEKWPHPRTGKLFPNFKPNQITMKFRRWAKECEMPEGISLHSFRSTFGNHIREDEGDIYIVSKLLGHSSVEVTAKHYMGASSEQLRRAVNSIRFNIDEDGDG